MAAALPLAAAAAPAAAGSSAASAFMNPAVLSSIFAALGPILKGITGNAGGPGSTFNEGQLGFMDRGLKALNPQMGDITQNQGYQQGSDWLSRLFNDPEFFKAFEAPILRDFQENTLPNVANRFAGMGTGGSTNSTAFRNQIGRESSKLHEMIASLRGGMQQQAIPQSLSYAQQPVSNYLNQLQQFLTPTENTYQSPSF